jgi:hypothetical protein
MNMGTLTDGPPEPAPEKELRPLYFPEAETEIDGDAATILLVTDSWSAAAPLAQARNVEWI